LWVAKTAAEKVPKTAALTAA
jgi:uncharacterized membrane protein